MIAAAVVVTAAALPVIAAGAEPGTTQAPAAGDRGEHGRGDVIANLFEWNWLSVANECTTVLGPTGYGGVQVAPPEDSLFRTVAATPTTPQHPWWEVYQPVDYNLTSRMGNEAQFKTMVAACRTAGVKVYVDAVINHMTGQGSISYGGVNYTHFEYPAAPSPNPGSLYTSADFHHPGPNPVTDCPTLGGGIDDFNNFLQVTHCELLGLADLRTESLTVRAKVAGYLNKLIDYGVSGFRVDAAKHIGQTDMAAIESLLHRTADGTRPYIAQENFPGGPGELDPAAFEGTGSLLGFDFAYQVHNAFNSYTNPPVGDITDLKVFGKDSGLLPSDKELVFVENHDTERGGDIGCGSGCTLSYKDGATNTIADEFMLADGWGTPQVYAGFAFKNNDDSPPADPATGLITNTDCSNGWVCVDRYTGVAHMVGWHNYVGDAPIENWTDDSSNLIAFSRGHRGWIAINNHTSAVTMAFATGLARGTYCDIIHGSLSGGACSGPTVRVGSGGTATVTIPAKDSVAFNGADRL
ncbi:MAG: alpha-amylase family protein [Candidatus Dormibacteraeota bacterium]|nr:alpha-amylase family protein [Candidatus Dormibacteraeota bacterium]